MNRKTEDQQSAVQLNYKWRRVIAPVLAYIWKYFSLGRPVQVFPPESNTRSGVLTHFSSFTSSLNVTESSIKKDSGVYSHKPPLLQFPEGAPALMGSFKVNFWSWKTTLAQSRLHWGQASGGVMRGGRQRLSATKSAATFKTKDSIAVNQVRKMAFWMENITKLKGLAC